MDLTNALTDTLFTFLRCMKEQMSSKEAQVSMVQLQTLHFLKQHPHSPMRKVAEYLGVELPSATSLVEKLVKTNIVERHTDEEDRRLVKISLTKKGDLLMAKAVEERRKNIEKVLSQLSSGDKKQLLTILKKLTATMGMRYER